MLDFDSWFRRNNHMEELYDLLKSAFTAGAAQAMNYVADDDTHPREVRFAGGTAVVSETEVRVIREAKGPVTP